ncbi:MAG TPA: helix-turn-helix domain-containing protein [Nocardioidaceae bacterium]|nr:helix-turn-helix domain-containing protein [Nocardioidaceae bacterium]
MPRIVFKSAWDIELVAHGIHGVSRFNEFQGQLGISRRMLAERLRVLVAEGIFERRQYQSRPDRYEYALTAKGRDLLPVLEAMSVWSARWRAEPDTR